MSSGGKNGSEGAAFLIDLDSGLAEPMQEVTFSSVGLQERQDLQRWVTLHPEIVAPDLLLVTTEFDRWEAREQKVADRLDVLFLDSTGAPVVAELKRDKATDTVELQALKYAAYCSQLTLDELAEEYGFTHELDVQGARQQLLDHAPSLEDGGLRRVKIRLVAGSFGPAVTSVVLWLRDYGIDIGCVEVAVLKVAAFGKAVLTSRQLLPLPEAEDYLVRRRRKEQEEDKARQAPSEWSWDEYAKNVPPNQLDVARRLFDDITTYVVDHGKPWTPVLRSWWLGYQRPGGYFVPYIKVHVEKPIEFVVKIPRAPQDLGFENPYPELRSRWNASAREWSWEVPSLDAVPDVAAAIDIADAHQPERGPMPRASVEA